MKIDLLSQAISGKGNEILTYSEKKCTGQKSWGTTDFFNDSHVQVRSFFFRMLKKFIYLRRKNEFLTLLFLPRTPGTTMVKTFCHPGWGGLI